MKPGRELDEEQWKLQVTFLEKPCWGIWEGRILLWITGRRVKKRLDSQIILNNVEGKARRPMQLDKQEEKNHDDP